MTRTLGIVEMLLAGVDTPEERARLLPGAAILLLAWAGFLLISGAHLGGGWEGGPLPPALRPGGFLLLVAASTGTGWWLLRREDASGAALGWLALLVAAYLAGNGLSHLTHRALPMERVLGTLGGGPLSPATRTALEFMGSRLLYAASVALPMLLVVARARRSLELPLPLRWGDLSVRTRLGAGDRLRSWRTLLALLGVAVGIPFFLLMQGAVGFGPLLGGRLPALALLLAGMALTNAFAEELLFRGLLQGGAVAAMGAARGMWATSLLFGLHHLGASFAPLASVPGALLLGVGSVVLAKAAHETGGLAWSVAFHAILNVGTFAAFYVAG